MSLTIKFDELLTFLSLRSHAGLIRVIFQGELGRGKLLFDNSSIKSLEYGGQKNDAALDLLLEEGEVQLIEIEDVTVHNEEELLYRIISKSLKKIGDYLGLLFLDDNGNVLLQKTEFREKTTVKDIVNSMKRILSTPQTMLSMEAGGLYIFIARIRKGLNAAVITRTAGSHRLLSSLFKGLLKITNR